MKGFSSDPTFQFNEVDKVTKSNKVKVYEPPFEVKADQALEEAISEIHKLVREKGSFSIAEIERFFILSLLKRFTKTKVAELTKLSIRTIGNKARKYESH